MINLISSESTNRLNNIVSYEGSATLSTKLDGAYPKSQSKISILRIYSNSQDGSIFSERYNPNTQIPQLARNIVYGHHLFK